MTLQNRVLPTGEITALPFRGTLMGNRGILHDECQRLKTKRWTHPHWVTCMLKYKDWHRPVMTPRNYTELFFSMNAPPWPPGIAPVASAAAMISPISNRYSWPQTTRAIKPQTTRAIKMTSTR